MGSLPVLRPREVIARLERPGFVEVRQRGSHKQCRHADGRAPTAQCMARETSLLASSARSVVTSTYRRRISSPLPTGGWSCRRPLRRSYAVAGEFTLTQRSLRLAAAPQLTCNRVRWTPRYRKSERFAVHGFAHRAEEGYA